MIAVCTKCSKTFETTEEEASAPDRLCVPCYKAWAERFDARKVAQGDAVRVPWGTVLDHDDLVEKLRAAGVDPERARIEDVAALIPGATVERRVSGPVDLGLASGERLAPGALDLSGLISEEQAREVLASYDAGGFAHSDMLRAACAKTGRPFPEAPPVEDIVAPYIEPDGTWSMRLRLLEDGKIEGSVEDERRAAAAAWIDHVERMLGEGERVDSGAPIESLADWIRNEGFLDETPALALLDEIRREREDRNKLAWRDSLMLDVEKALAAGVLDIARAVVALNEAGFPSLARVLASTGEATSTMGPKVPVVLADGREIGTRQEVLTGENAGAWILIFSSDYVSAADYAEVEEMMRRLDEERAGLAPEVRPPLRLTIRPDDPPLDPEVPTFEGKVEAVVEAEIVGPCPLCGKPLRRLRWGGVECSNPMCDAMIPF